MGVITISREYGSGGEEVAAKVAKENGYRIIAREEIEKTLIEIAGESMAGKVLTEKAPGIIERFTTDTAIHKNLLCESILFFAREGKVIIIGRGSFSIFSDTPGAMNILITGDREARSKYISEKENMSLLHAEEKLHRVDWERAGFLKYYFGYDWPIPSHFHFSITPLSVGIDGSARAVTALASLLNISENFHKEGKQVVRERYSFAATKNRLILSLGLEPDQFSLRLKEGKIVEVQFFNVTTELRDKAAAIIGKYLEGYKISAV